VVNGLLGRFLLSKKAILSPIYPPLYWGKNMNKIIKIFPIFVLLILTTSGQADAAVFNWRVSYLYPDKYTEAKVNDFDFAKVANKSFGVSRVLNSAEKDTEKESDKKDVQIVKTYIVRATAYSSTVDQTDSTPFITASGTYVRDGIIAANFLPFGTTVRIPEIYGDKVFVVEDRMNQRYWHNIDIWFPERGLAKEFGARKVKIEIVSESSDS